VLTAHGSADPRSAASAHELAHTIRRMRRDVDVRVAFCEQNSPNLRDVLAVPARTPSWCVAARRCVSRPRRHPRDDQRIGATCRQADCSARTTAHRGASATLDARRSVATRLQRWVLVTAVGSSRAQANARTASVRRPTRGAHQVDRHTSVRNGPQPTLAEAADVLRARGATRLIIAPWFLASRSITDRIADYARAHRIPMAAPLGPHRLVADTVLDRFDEAVAARAAA